MTPDQISDLLLHFNTYLVEDQKLSPGSARLYMSSVSAALRKHAVGPDDVDKLIGYYAGLAARAPSQAHLFTVSWRHFARFMQAQGFEVATLARKNDEELGPPVSAIFDLHSELADVPMTQLAKLTWGQVEPEDGRPSVLITLPRKAHPQRFLLTQLGEAALTALQNWGYRTTFPPTPMGFVIPSAPDVNESISTQALTRLISSERAKRRQMAPQTEQRGLTYVVEARARPVIAEPSATEIAARRANILGEGPDPFASFGKKLAVASAVTPPNITEEMKLANYHSWRAETPLSQELDEFLFELEDLASHTPEAHFRYWRCIRWETGKNNDLGPPPAGVPLRIVTRTPPPPLVMVKMDYTDQTFVAKLVEAVDNETYVLTTAEERAAYDAFKAAQSSSPQVATADGATGSNVSTGDGAASLGKS